jgi:uncharacterized membrane protein
MTELPAQPQHSHLTTWIVLLAALGIIGTWTFFTQAGLMGKADAVGYAICHRIESRSFQAFGRALPLCARCTGIYLGVVLGIGVFTASGRARASQLPHWKVAIPLGLFVAVMGVDGLNSYLSLFPGYQPVYEPQNWLRLTTGVFCGLSLISLVWPIFHQSIWEDGGQATHPIRNLKELGGLMLLAILMIALVLAQNATILLVLGFLSAVGVVSVLTMILTVMFVTILQTFRTYRTWGQLRLPLLAGLTLAIGLIGLIDLARYQFTGTWGGFVF